MTDSSVTKGSDDVKREDTEISLPPSIDLHSSLSNTRHSVRLNSESIVPQSVVTERVISEPEKEIVASSGDFSTSTNLMNNASSKVVSEPGSCTSSTSPLTMWLRPFVRFPPPPTIAEAHKQWDSRERYLSMNSLAAATDWKSEEEAEDWFDTVARVVMQHGLSVEVFGYLVSRYLSPAESEDFLLQCKPETTYEKWVDRYLLCRFPRSTYARELEQNSYSLSVMTSVSAVRAHVRKFLSRYMQVCVRHGRTLTLSVERAREYTVNSLPREVQYHIEMEETMRGPCVSFDDLISQATGVECVLKRQTVLKVKGYPAEEWDEEREDTYKRSSNSSYVQPTSDKIKTQPSTPCAACMGNHWQKDCPHRSHRCEQCLRLGHIEKACKSLVLRTPDGRIDVMVTPKPSSVEFKQFKDRTQQERLTSATSVLQEVIQGIQAKRVKESERRKSKKPPKTNKRKRIGIVKVVDSDTDWKSEEEVGVVWAAVAEDPPDQLTSS